jgi:hypothetical protein
MVQTWQRSGRIAAGGGVLSIGVDVKRRTWLATSGGVLVAEDGGWRPLPLPSPVERAGLVGSADSDWWVAGLSGGLALTWDGGTSWALAWIDQVSELITCFAVSPRYGRDLTLLAGTAGAGILRSSGGGRRWQLSNFGLEEFTILALATAGDWSRRQVVFAGTADGVYRSSGGGRAWKAVGLKGLTVQCLAAARRPPLDTSGASAAGAMPDASGAWTILAGTESDGLYRAQDGGFTWEPCGQEIGDGTAINALLCLKAADGDAWFAGTDAGAIWRSADNGGGWSLVCEMDGPVLVLAEGPDRLLAGSLEHGLWVSTDLGLTWHPDGALCAWGFRRLYRTGERRLAALAPAGGVWLSAGAGEGWERVLEASLYEPVLAYATLGTTWLAARAGGVWRGVRGTNSALVLEAVDAPIVALSHSGVSGEVWAGAADGSLWSSGDKGGSWQALDVPFRGRRLLGLAFSPEDGTPLVGTFGGEHKEVTLWRLVDGRWQSWLSRSDTWAGLALAPAGPRGEATWAALGGKLYAHTASGWQEVDMPGHAWSRPAASPAREDEVTAITGLTPDGSRYLISGAEMLCCDAAGGWRCLPLPEGGAPPVDLCLPHAAELLCLDAAGVIWRLDS